jgi:hypothetical protein
MQNPPLGKPPPLTPTYPSGGPPLAKYFICETIPPPPLRRDTGSSCQQPTPLPLPLNIMLLEIRRQTQTDRGRRTPFSRSGIPLPPPSCTAHQSVLYISKQKTLTFLQPYRLLVSPDLTGGWRGGGGGGKHGIDLMLSHCAVACEIQPVVLTFFLSIGWRSVPQRRRTAWERGVKQRRERGRLLAAAPTLAIAHRELQLQVHVPGCWTGQRR